MRNLKLKILANLLSNLSKDCERASEGKEPLYNSNITESEIDKIMEELAVMNDKKLSKDQAAIYLNMSKSTFDRKVADGKLPQGRKTEGWKELWWSKFELDKLIRQNK